MLKHTNHRSLTFPLLLTLFFLAVPFGRHLVVAQQPDYREGDIVEVKWIEDWVIAKVDKCLNASTCMVYFYDVRTGKYDTRSTAIMMDHIRATAKRPATQSDTSRPRQGNDDAVVNVTNITLATPALNLPECSFDAPGTKVSRTAPASALLFKRVIYDWFALDVKEGGTTNPLRVGLTFLEFQMGKSFVNRVYVDPGTGAQRLHDGAPVGAMIYPVKTKYMHCRGYRGEILREVVQENFACFKDRFGDWVCPTDSVRQILETKSIPIQN
jgi:hypothetical protein